LVLHHKWKFVSGDPSKCVGCCVCEYVCSMEHEKTYNATKSRIRVVRLDPFVNLAIACRFCEDPQCVIACPREALVQSEETGVIMVDEGICNGCAWCVEACDFGSIQLHPESRVAFVCDLCDGDPRCVEWCPEEALDFTTSEILAQKARISSAKKMFRKALITTT
jgi:carbon-monoxide dehydrogenase iron sulfur subunit